MRRRPTSTITAIYRPASVFHLDFDIQKAHKYWFKWDTLFVIRKAGEEAIEYSPVSSAEEDHECYKTPAEVIVE